MEDETDDGEVNPLSSLECEYTISRVGYYCLTVRLGKHHIRTSPGWVIGMPGRSHARSSVAYGPGLVVAHPHQVNTFTIESRDCLGNTRAGVVSVEEDEDETFIEKDDFVIGVIGPAMIEGGVIESQMDDYGELLLFAKRLFIHVSNLTYINLFHGILFYSPLFLSPLFFSPFFFKTQRNVVTWKSNSTNVTNPCTSQDSISI